MAEYDIQLLCLEWLEAAHPDVIYRTDMGGVKLPIGLARKSAALQKFRGYPDVSIDHAVGGYHGLKVELKQPGEVLGKNDNLLATNRIHHIEQAAILIQLAERGYAVDIAIGYDSFVATVQSYMAGTLEPLGSGVISKIIDQATDADIQAALVQSYGFVTDAILFAANNYRRQY